jgi:uncharacterized protein (UPF0332 family)
MATWQKIGIDSFRAGRELLEGKRYRSSASRSYYAAFSLLTYELARTGVIFGRGRQTPAHSEMTDLITVHLTQFSETRRRAIALLALRLYRLRLDADYSVQRIDRLAAEKALRDVTKIFRHFGVNP